MSKQKAMALSNTKQYIFTEHPVMRDQSSAYGNFSNLTHQFRVCSRQSACKHIFNEINMLNMHKDS